MIVVAELEELRNIVRGVMIEVLDERPTVSPVIERQTTARHFTRREVLELLRISAPTLREMEKRRELIPIRIGRKVLFDSEAVALALERIAGRV